MHRLEDSSYTKELYFSADIETTGPVAPDFSMISIGVYAFDGNGTKVGSFSCNLKELEGAKRCPEVMEWWKDHPEAWEKTQVLQYSPEYAMRRLDAFVRELCLKTESVPVFVGYPATFDFAFIYWYLLHFTGKCVFSFAGLDIKSYAMAVLKCPFKDATRRKFPKRWRKKEGKLLHEALSDAKGQAELFLAMLRENTDANGE